MHGCSPHQDSVGKKWMSDSTGLFCVSKSWKPECKVISGRGGGQRQGRIPYSEA